MSVPTGASQIVAFIFEDKNEFAQDPTSNTLTDTNFKPFGSNETMDSQDRDQNPTRLFRPFDRAADEILEGAFDGSWSVDATLTNAHWLRMVYGDPAVSGTNSNTYTFSYRQTEPVRTAQIIEETHYPDGEIVQTVYVGCLLSSADLSVSLEDPVDLSLDGSYATEYTRSTAEGEDLIYGDVAGGLDSAEGGQPETLARPLHFGNSELRLDYDDDGTPEFTSLVQDADVSFDGNAELQGEIGTRFSVAPSYLEFEPDLSFTRLIDTTDKDTGKRQMYGDSAGIQPQETMQDSTMDGKLVMDAGLSGELNTFEIDLKGTFPDSYSRSNVGDPTDTLEEDVDRFITSIEAVVESDKHDLTS